MTPEEIGRALRTDIDVDDAEIDVHLSERSRRVSGRYWTPVSVGMKAARWLARAGAERVLDVGSGAGKFCVTAALATELDVTGIEQRADLVAEAAALARRFGVQDRARFVAGVIQDVDLAEFDGLYVFNSFAENLFFPSERLDASVELGPARMRRDVTTVESALERMRVGAVLATYHGFGGAVPDSFERIHEEPCGTDVLRVWMKRRASSGARWIEVDDGVRLRDV